MNANKATKLVSVGNVWLKMNMPIFFFLQIFFGILHNVHTDITCRVHGVRCVERGALTYLQNVEQAIYTVHLESHSVLDAGEVHCLEAGLECLQAWC
jgi:hypothetical protein